MNDNVIITVIGVQADMIDNEKIELQTTGKWFTKNGKDHIVYTNHDLVEDSDTRTRVSIEQASVSIIRSGAVNTHMVFEEGKSHLIPYETPFGILDMISTTRSLSLKKSPNELELKVIYNLEINNSDTGENVFHLVAKRLDHHKD